MTAPPTQIAALIAFVSYSEPLSALWQKSNAFNHYFFNIMVIIADQRSRPGNKGVIFTIEQPAGGAPLHLHHAPQCVAHRHPWLAAGHYPLYDLERLKLPEKQGGIGAVELKINFCKFASGKLAILSPSNIFPSPTFTTRGSAGPEAPA